MEQHRWIAVLCLILLHLQFSPVSSSCVVNDEGIAEEEEDEIDQDFPYKDETDGSLDNNDEDDTHESALGKRNWLSSLGSYLFKALKFGVKYGDELTSLVDLSVSLPVAIGGCKTLYPSIQTNWDRVKGLDKEFQTLSKQIDDLSRDAAIMQCYGKSSMRQYRLAREKMEDITIAQKLTFEAMSPKFSNALRNTTEYIKNVAEKKNNTKEQVDAIEVITMYDSDLEKVFDIVFPSLVLAVPGFKRLYKRTKNTAIATRIVQIESDLKLRLGIPDGGPDYEPLLGSTYMADKPRRVKRVSKLLDDVKAKYKDGHSLLSKVGKGIKGLFSLGSSALNIWSTIGTIQGCENIRDESKRSADLMEYFVQNTSLYLDDVKGTYQKGQEAWNKIVDVAWEKNMLTALEQVEEMIKDPYFTRDKQLSDFVLKSLRDYIDANGNTGTPSNANGLQRSLTNALKTVPIPLQCHKIKGAMFCKISEKCTDGINTFDRIYDSVKDQYMFDSERYKCAEKTENEYISVGILENAWKKSIEGNNDIKEKCIFNNKVLLDEVQRQIDMGATPEDAARIAEQFSNPHFADDIEELMRNMPKPVTPSLPSLAAQQTICMGKIFEPDFTDEQILETVKDDYPDITIEQIRNVDCSKFDF